MNSIKKIWLWIKNFLFTEDTKGEDSPKVEPAPLLNTSKQVPTQTTQIQPIVKTQPVYVAPYVAPSSNSYYEMDQAAKKRRDDEEDERRRRNNYDDSGSDMMTAALLASLISTNTESKPESEPKFESGKGGDYSGAGASGSWESTPEPVRHFSYTVPSESVQTYESKSESSSRTDSYESTSRYESSSNNDSYSDNSSSSSSDSYSSSD